MLRIQCAIIRSAGHYLFFIFLRVEGLNAGTDSQNTVRDLLSVVIAALQTSFHPAIIRRANPELKFFISEVQLITGINPGFFAKWFRLFFTLFEKVQKNIGTQLCFQLINQLSVSSQKFFLRVFHY